MVKPSRNAIKMVAMAAIVMIAFAVAAPGAVAECEVATGFISFEMNVKGETRDAVVYVPRKYDPARTWPLVVFLHGMGERGDDGWKQAEVGMGRAIRLHPERFPALVVMPQCPVSTTWSSSENPEGAPASEHIDAAIAHVTQNYTVDPDRVTLTGLSMGGYGAFRYGAENADRFAAFMAVCGGGRTDDAQALAARPMRVYHGGADTVVKPEQSRRMVEAIRSAGGDVAYTEYEGVGHNSWDRAYGDPDAIAWLLRQAR